MHVNSTCISGRNSSADCFPETKPLGLAIGLPVVFVVLLLMGMVAILWFKHRKSSHAELSDKSGKSQERSSVSHAIESEYSGYVGGHQISPQSPIYENFQRGEPKLQQFQMSAVQNEDQSVHQEQSDPHDAIYSNDPTLFHREISEDVYIMPDA